MNTKQLIIILIIALTFYAMRGNDQSSQQPAQVVDCGAAPGDASLATRLAWGLCESKKSADADQAVQNGR